MANKQHAALGEAQAFVSKAFRWPYEKCLLWPFSVRISNKVPTPCVGHCRKIVSVRRLLLEMAGNYSTPEANAVSATCENPLCVNPNHLFWNSPKDIVRRQIERKTFCNVKPQRLLGHYKAVSLDTVKSIFEAEGKQRFIAKQFGVTQGFVSLIKTKKHWSQTNGA